MSKKYKPDWSQFRLTIPISATPKKVFSAWTKPEELCRWFLAGAEMDLRPGSVYTWRWHTGTPDKGRILSVRRPSRLSFSFDRGSICEVSINRRGRGSLVILRQYRIPVNEESKYRVYSGCKAGWTFYMANLKAYLEKKVDLRETRPEFLKLQGLLNQG